MRKLWVLLLVLAGVGVLACSTSLPAEEQEETQDLVREEDGERPVRTAEPVLLPTPILEIESDSSPPEPEPSTEVEPALTETITPDHGLEGEPNSEQRESEFVDLEPAANGDPTATPAPEVETEPTTEVSESVVEVEAHGIDVSHYGMSVASVEERIYLADVIVRARLISSANNVLTFNALEYLKGSGPSRFRINVDAPRDTQWDGREAILFLDLPDGVTGRNGGPTFELTDTTSFDYGDGRATEYAGTLAKGNLIDNRNPVWLPSDSLSISGQSGGQGNDYITASTDVNGTSQPTISLADLKELIAWVEGGEGIEGYDQCVLDSLSHLRSARDLLTRWPHRPEVSVYDRVVDGGSVGVDFAELGEWQGSWRNPGYPKFWLDGADSVHFQAQIADEDGDAFTGYEPQVSLVRPLPAGEYYNELQMQGVAYQICNFIPRYSRFGLRVIVIAPLGTVHEALFDPADLPSGTGFSSKVGSLTSAEFSVSGTATTVTGLRWEAGSVVLALDPFVDLGGHHLQVISMDGSMDLSLAAPSATANTEAGTLTWAVVDRPWGSGDQLMLRIWSPPDTEPRVPVPDAETISAGWGYTCRLEADGLAVCWGRNDDGQSNPPSGERFVAISAGNSYACGLRVEGDAMCWGSNGSTMQFFAFERFEVISAGGNHTCGLSPDGGVVCWSPRDFSESGPPPGVRFKAIGAGSGYVCGLRKDGEAVCWTTDGGG